MVQRFGLPSTLCWTTNDTNTPHTIEVEKMHSPLPDSSALEAGLLEDDRPSHSSRLSRVQDNVRNLLRTSIFGSVKSSPTTPTHPPALRTNSVHVVSICSPNEPEVLPSPTEVATPPARYPQTSRGELFPPTQYQQQVQEMARQSMLFNTRAVAALNHPDLSDPSVTELSQVKEQSRPRIGWTRPKKRSRRTKAARRAAGSRGVLCLLASLLLAALVATYVSIATTEVDLTPTFHILFVLGICLATIVFAHSVIRLFFIGRRSRHKPLFVTVSRHGQHRYHHRPGHSRSHPSLRQMPSLSAEHNAFVPDRPIPVSLSSDDIRLDPNVAGPTMIPPQDWDKEVHSVPNPPPAYGRWRGSVRADPELLHWQAVPAPRSPATPALPSPTYEEAGQIESPPSYMTRESPARLRREVRDVRAGIARSQVVEPEMVEARGAGAGAGSGVGQAM
ncbi:uncharacterized protein CLAFUR5_11809 [Fulvia fulva]|uniref:Uncharacterized protein n=1 Tax=Passalora fulva TaxID=5499 RepID=A0A9Q8PIE2_PASFU|nr:uncharacterized protein CLAFUR5_11809 [Fulvia fulva]KAK4627568.1 hypothetical protein CLAFUR0_05088 [Fulvia fulva]UJO23091.1 hypothetical protein CLAFUR5_11809 [Fulvia fulva]WPV28168.1 hypothetical protein CLAFUW7_05092 [Fulvia fulva]